jgi:hypothetical protein
VTRKTNGSQIGHQKVQNGPIQYRQQVLFSAVWNSVLEFKTEPNELDWNEILHTPEQIRFQDLPKFWAQLDLWITRRFKNTARNWGFVGGFLERVQTEFFSNHDQNLQQLGVCSGQKSVTHHQSISKPNPLKGIKGFHQQHKIGEKEKPRL